MGVIRISREAIKQDLKNGLTRLSNDVKFDPRIGCIQNKYGLTTEQVKEIFKHPELKGLKTLNPKDKVVFIEDEIGTPENGSMSTTTISYGTVIDPIMDAELPSSDINPAIDFNAENTLDSVPTEEENPSSNLF